MQRLQEPARGVSLPGHHKCLASVVILACTSHIIKAPLLEAVVLRMALDLVITIVVTNVVQILSRLERIRCTCRMQGCKQTTELGSSASRRKPQHAGVQASKQQAWSKCWQPATKGINQPSSCKQTAGRKGFYRQARQGTGAAAHLKTCLLQKPHLCNSHCRPCNKACDLYSDESGNCLLELHPSDIHSCHSCCRCLLHCFPSQKRRILQFPGISLPPLQGRRSTCTWVVSSCPHLSRARLGHSRCRSYKPVFLF